MSLQTPLGKVRHHGSARSGTNHFWHQRLTAMANIPLVIFLIWLVISVSGASHAEAAAVIKQPLVSVGLLAVMVSFCWHMQLGMQVIIEDYVHSEPARILLLTANVLFSAGVAFLSMFAILKISFGA